jgi:hypothetical protein
MSRDLLEESVRGLSRVIAGFPHSAAGRIAGGTQLGSFSPRALKED